tara:strand:+ start:68 stop:946 length:879 start_codon:yes stop_codon:yes gene_type:complete
MSTLTVGTISEKVTDAGVAVDGVTLKDGDVTIADKIIHDGDTNTAIRFPSADTVTIETGGSERARVSSGGVITVGKTDQTANVVGTEIEGTGTIVSTRDGNTNMFLNRKTSFGNLMEFRKDNSAVGFINTPFTEEMIFGASGTNSNGVLMSSANQLRPCKNGSTSDNTQDLGASNGRWNDVFATNGTIQTSDRNEKQDIEELSDAEKRVAVVAKGLMRKFRWKDKVAEKGDNARTHFGIIAQDLQDAFTAEGLDASKYAMFCSDTWTDDDGKEQTRLGVRYSELLAFIISAI